MRVYFLRKFLIMLLIIAAGIFLNAYFFHNYFQNHFYKIAIKPGVFFTSKLLGLSRLADGFSRTQVIIDENGKLRIENDVLRGQLAELDASKRENKFLRDELGVSEKLDSPLLLAQIFNIQKGVTSSTALINRGTKDGVKKTLPVIAAGNILVGIIDEVYDNAALILLVDDPRMVVSGRIQGSNTLVGTRGALRNNLAIELVASSDEVGEGDVVLTSGLDGLSEALLVAKVSKVEISTGAIFKTVSAVPFFDPSLGSSLFVILK